MCAFVRVMWARMHARPVLPGSGSTPTDTSFKGLEVVYFVMGGRPLIKEIEVPVPTARQRVIRILQQHPEGLSKSQLRDEVGGNAGAFRRLIQSMIDKDEISVREEDRPDCGPTKVHTLGEEIEQAA